MAYASRLLREQSIAKKSFVEVMPRCPLLLCPVGDRWVRQRAIAPLLHAIPRAVAAAAPLSLPPRRSALSRSRHRFAGARCWSRTAVQPSAPEFRPPHRHPRCWFDVSPTRSRHLLSPLLLVIRPPAGATEARRP
ncbi:hypothetical protein Scep_025992 [Stephania cephalantha]|uniref:Uncharacterized protein n=1 Tax=Stephania cephalantha TaxID=152367 RepID=A0AAP0ERI7_9MAGN